MATLFAPAQHHPLPGLRGYKQHAHSSATPSPLSRSQGGTRSPSPAPSTSSLCSKGTSIDDPGEWPKIDQIRPMYDRHSASLADRVGDMEFLADGDGDEDDTRHHDAYDETSAGSVASSSSRPQLLDNGPAPSSSEKGREKRRFPEEEEEDLLRETNDRFVLFPIKYREVRRTAGHHPSISLTVQIWEAYKSSQACFWTAEEIDLSHDLHDWEDRLTPNERFFILRACNSILTVKVELTRQVSWRSLPHQTG